MKTTNIGFDLATLIIAMSAIFFAFGSAYEQGFVAEIGLSPYLIKTDLYSILLNGFLTTFSSFLIAPISSIFSLPLLVGTGYLFYNKSRYVIYAILTFVFVHLVVSGETGQEVARNTLNLADEKLNSDAGLSQITYLESGKAIIKLEGIIISLPSEYIFLKTINGIVAIPKTKVVKINFG